MLADLPFVMGDAGKETEPLVACKGLDSAAAAAAAASAG